MEWGEQEKQRRSPMTISEEDDEEEMYNLTLEEQTELDKFLEEKLE